MLEFVNRILEGNFVQETNLLSFSHERLELLLPQGTFYEGSFRITAPEGSFATGFVTSSDWRMECLTSEFTGRDEEISFCFHAETMEEGEQAEGFFFVVSSQGEYELPFTVTIAYQEIVSSIGAVKNLFHFANLAKSNWPEAVNLFYAPKFERIFVGDDKRFLDAYRALSAYPGQEQNVEEFLIHANKKQKNEYTTEDVQIEMELPLSGNSCSVYERELVIVRNGWGYTWLSVESEGTFLFTEKEALTDDDFLGNRCRLPVFIDGNLCRKGRNFGRIFLYNSYVCLEIPVTVSMGEGRSAKTIDLGAKRATVHIMDLYQAFRLKKISTKNWLFETGKLVERMVAQEEKNAAYRLFQAQLFLTQERYSEAEWTLDYAARLMGEDEKESVLWAYYLYLTTLMNRDEAYVNHAAAQVKQIFRKDTANWRVAWLMLYLSEDFQKSASRKWVFLEKQFSYGCSSPVLYIEALALLNNNPALLRKPGVFELQILHFGARKQALSPGVIEQILYLAGRTREFSPVLLKVLIYLYEAEPDVRILQEICGLLIKGGKTGKACFQWYKAGVEAQLRITNLYEYFMASLDLEAKQPIPRIVLMYFSYQNNLDWEHSACLYDYILQSRESYPELYDAYRGRMERFVVERIQKRQINRHLASLYKAFITPGMINPQTASALARLLFAYRVRVEDGRLQRVYVYQPGNTEPAQYQLSGGTTWVSLYGSEYTLVFEDAYGNRFTKNAAYTLEELLYPEGYLEMAAPYVRDCPELDLYLYQMGGLPDETPEAAAARMLRIAESGWAASEIKRGCYPKILQYYYDTDNMRGMDEYLVRIPVCELSVKERKTVLKYMVLRGLYDAAYGILKTYGPYFADPAVLMRLISPVMERGNLVEDTLLTAAAEYAFAQGKYDGTILAYLALYYRGKLSVMRNVWKAAKSYEVDCYRLSEKLLLQMMYTSVFPEEKTEIFRYYVSQGAKQEVEEAFLSQCAYLYFTESEDMEEYMLREIKNMYLRNEEVQKICRLAYLKYYAEHRDKTDEGTEKLLKVFLEEMAAEGIHLDFLRKFKECALLQQDMMDKTIIVHHASYGSKATIHYALLHENKETDEYRSEYMREICGGICFAEFVLFFGERLRYSIVEEKDGKERKTAEGIVQKSDEAEGSSPGKFRLINDIVISKTLQDYDTMEKLLETYYSREYYNGRLFELR